MTTPTTATGAPHSVAPTVFISSTVLDLADLRAGIKYVLKQSGANVLMSESSDFMLYGDKSACEECFENIRGSDLYVLLLDKRQGSEYEPGVSVTRQELRVARESFLKTGKPYQLLFVRRGVQDLSMKEDGDLLEIGVDKPEHLREFIKEIKHPQDQTTHNFLKEFTSLDDIVDAITARLNLGKNLAESIVRRSVYVELTRNLAKMVHRVGESALQNYAWLITMLEEYDFHILPMTGTVSVSESHRTRIIMGVLGRLKSSYFEVDAIRNAVKGGIFLDYDPSDGKIIETKTHQALVQVLDDIAALSSLDSNGWDSRILLSLSSSGPNQVSVFDLFCTFGFANRSENLFNSIRMACWLLSGSKYENLVLPRIPVTPLGPEEDLQIRKERIESWEVDQLLRQDIFPFGFRYPSELGEKTRESRLGQAVEQMREIAVSNPQLQLDDSQIVEFAESLVDRMTAKPDEGLIEPFA